MKINIDALMIILLVIFIADFIALVIYGELWQIRLPTTDARMDEKVFDYERVRNLFIVSCVAIASGTSMLYIFETKFSPNEKRQQELKQTSLNKQGKSGN